MNIHVLDLPFDYNGAAAILNPVLLQHDDALVLVDCGYPGFLPLLEKAIAEKGFSLQQLTGVIITHHDIDHMGALHELKAAYPQVKVYAYTTDAPYVSGAQESLRLAQAMQMLEHMPVDERGWAEAFIAQLNTLQPVPVDGTFTDGEEIAFLPGVRVIHTPGHMPGHISLYDAGSNTCIAADAVVVEQGALEIANPQFCLDLPGAVASVEILSRLNISQLVCYHGGMVQGNVIEQLKALHKKYTA